jgi:FkbM family methyltransferase
MDLTQVALSAHGREVTLKLIAGDHVTKSILTTSDFYERPLLDDIMRRTQPEDMVVDLGAYVGTHTTFLAAVAELRIIAVEPNPLSADLLQQNIDLNHISDLVELHRVAVGSEEGFGELVTRDEHNLGMTAIKEGDGDVSIQTLDRLVAERDVAAIKIDVEGMEPQALEGALDTIARSRPAIYVEVANLVMERTLLAVLRPLDYRFVREFNATPTQLFLPTEHVAPTLYPESLAEQASEQAYALADALKAVNTLARRVDAMRLSMNQLARHLAKIEESSLNEATQTSEGAGEPTAVDPEED